jgi:hypothetical protein
MVKEMAGNKHKQKSYKRMVNLFTLEKIQLQIHELIHGEIYYTPDELFGSGGKENNIIEFDERINYLLHFGHNPIFYRIMSKSQSEVLSKLALM